MSDETEDVTKTRARIESKLVEWGLAQPGHDAHNYADKLVTLVQSLGEARCQQLKACAKSAVQTVDTALKRVQQMTPIFDSARAFIHYKQEHASMFGSELDTLEHNVENYDRNIASKMN